MFVYLLFGLQIHVDLFYCMGHLILQFKLKKGWICLYLLLHFCNTLVLFYEMVLIIWNNCSVFFSTVFVWYCIRMFVYIINACLLGIPWTRQQRQQNKQKNHLTVIDLGETISYMMYQFCKLPPQSICSHHLLTPDG